MPNVAFARKIPLEILLIPGAPGTGKTSAFIQLILACVLAGKRAGVYASTNAATNNIVIRAMNANEKQRLIDLDGMLVIRLWTDQIECKILQSIDADNLQEFLDKYVAKS
ncbi:hypothetical protein G7Y89_g524 [Cudoniella acicularis]|uniref:DNA2/NAM7 helicase helicase domain-containing protein n=1 Tax=Cudoniella acicularis TaxID=354080 RepID=A0A8H4RYP9_9HELO|nr:hypothetical protein G7Y89_g524 [Cudoniella acicularis]